MEHKTAFLYLQPGIILQKGGKNYHFNSTEIHKPSPNFHSSWNSPVSTIGMKMRISLSGGNGSVLISKVCEQSSRDGGGRLPTGKVSITQTCRTSCGNSPWGLGASGLTSVKPYTIPGQGRPEAEFKKPGKCREVIPSGYVSPSGLHRGDLQH